MYPQPLPHLDPRAALVQIMAQQQHAQHPVHAGMARAQAVGSLHQIAQALAAQVARQKAPLGKARVAQTDIGGMMQNPAYAPPQPQGLDPAIMAALAAHHSQIDGGYSGAWAVPGVSRQGFAGNHG